MSRQAPLVLVVEDDRDGREVCIEGLLMFGFRAVGASDGFEAIEKATVLLPDVILMDLGLPGIDGFETIRRLKANARTRAIPVIAVTGQSRAGIADRVIAAGCVGFIAKPYFPNALADEIRRVLGLLEPPARDM